MVQFKTVIVILLKPNWEMCVRAHHLCMSILTTMRPSNLKHGSNLVFISSQPLWLYQSDLKSGRLCKGKQRPLQARSKPVQLQKSQLSPEITALYNLYKLDDALAAQHPNGFCSSSFYILWVLNAENESSLNPVQ